MKFSERIEQRLNESKFMARIRSLNKGGRIAAEIQDGLEDGELLDNMLNALSDKQITQLGIYLNMRGLSSIQPNTKAAKLEKISSHLKDVWKLK